MPLAEKTLREPRKFAEDHGDSYQYFGDPHGTQKDTNDYMEELDGANNIKVISDPDFDIYDRWV